MITDFFLQYDMIIKLTGYVLVLSGVYWNLYWKMKIGFKELDLKIEEIKCDRKDKWEKYGEDRNKSEACLSEIMKAVGEVRGDVRSIKTNIEWLKKSG